MAAGYSEIFFHVEKFGGDAFGNWQPFVVLSSVMRRLLGAFMGNFSLEMSGLIGNPC